MRAMYKTSHKIEIRERQKHYSERCTDNALREIQGNAGSATHYCRRDRTICSSLNASCRHRVDRGTQARNLYVLVVGMICFCFTSSRKIGLSSVVWHVFVSSSWRTIKRTTKGVPSWSCISPWSHKISFCGMDILSGHRGVELLEL